MEWKEKWEDVEEAAGTEEWRQRKDETEKGGEEEAGEARDGREKKQEGRGEAMEIKKKG